MKNEMIYDKRHEIFEKIMITGLTIFTAVAIIQLIGLEHLIGPALFALCCLSIALPFLIFQIACLTLGVTQQHRFLLQTATVIVALAGIFGLLISISPIVGTLFVISCICAYYLFALYTKESNN
jgi:hypothetical protein